MHQRLHARNTPWAQHLEGSYVTREQVRDLPGVLVEVTSPALIQKVRSTTTDPSGQYRITNLPVGTSTGRVTFTAPVPN